MSYFEGLYVVELVFELISFESEIVCVRVVSSVVDFLKYVEGYGGYVSLVNKFLVEVEVHVY